MATRRFRIKLLSVAVAVGVTGCSTTELVSNKEDHLLAAGFIDHPANTPERQAMLTKLPPNKFVRRVRDEKVAYVYADPMVCNCLYVGSQSAYGKYKQFMEQQSLADEQQMTALDYSDSGWNWNAWGGGWGGGFGRGFWGGGPGW